MKYAIFTMDVEDFSEISSLVNKPNENFPSMMDGMDVFADLLDKHSIKGTFFALANRISSDKERILKVMERGHHVGLHGLNHSIPTDLRDEDFSEDIKEGKAILEREFGIEIRGYRAPGFGISKANLEAVRNAGFRYDSSVLPVSRNYPSYGHSISFDGYREAIPHQVYEKEGFYSFLMPVFKGSLIKEFPVGGGIYSRLFPHNLFKRCLKKFMSQSSIYIFYAHPFEFSNVKAPAIKGLMPHERMYINDCRGSKYLKRVEAIIGLLKENGFEFTDYETLIDKLSVD